MNVKCPTVDENALQSFRKARLNGVLAGLSSVTLKRLRSGPMCLFRRGWRLMAPEDLSPSQARRYAVGAPPELGQILTIDLASRSVQLETFVNASVQQLMAPLSGAWRNTV